MGIGFGIATCFVEAGANVLVADIDGSAAEAAAGRLAGRRGRAAALHVDVGSDNAGDTMVRRCVELFGSIDILVNNAGIFPVSSVLQLKPEVLDRIYRINLRGLILASKSAANAMVERRRGGKIINIASIDAFHPSYVGLGAYGASKGGVVMFTKSLALELGPHGIMVNAIAPGAITTEGSSRPLEGMTEEQAEKVGRDFFPRIALGRAGVPDDIGNVAVFLASSASDYITGQTLVVDGGRLLG